MRTILVSNRLPVTVSACNGLVEMERSVGGLATGLSAVHEGGSSLWIGWPGVTPEQAGERCMSEMAERLGREHSCVPVPLHDDDIDLYYHGFANKTIWPLFHYFPQFATYNDDYWRGYVEVNRRFADTVVEAATIDDVIWVHDYHLMLVPALIREKMPEATIGFFLHIPFPAFETFRLLPWRLELLSGLLGSSLVGFHTYDYVKHFFDCVRSLIGHEHVSGTLSAGKRAIRADSFPMGIDFERFTAASKEPDVLAHASSVREKIQGRRLILSIDRLDYSKGLLQRVDALDAFFERYPEYLEKVQIVLVAVPSRADVSEYEDMKRALDEAVGGLNGKYGSIGWSPIEYMYTSLDFSELAAMYTTAEVCLVTPLRDGMNLIAKEYVATTGRAGGVLVLSEMAGAAKELGEALIVNPNNRDEVASAIRSALEMPPAERSRRNESMLVRLERYDVQAWASDFLTALDKAREREVELSATILSREARDALVQEYLEATSRLIVLDYDGTLVSHTRSPGLATPSDDVVDSIASLASDSANEVVIASGRDRESLAGWLGHTGAHLVAEHGAFLRLPDSEEWVRLIPEGEGWKDDFRNLLETFVDRTPGSLLEEKEYSLVWHYRNADQEMAAVRMRELKDAAINLATNLGVEIAEGEKIIEIKDGRSSETAALERWLSRSPSFVVAFGDDRTDEDVFKLIGDSGHTIKVGVGPSSARWRVESVEVVQEFLGRLAASAKEKAQGA